ncbi:MAG: ferritin [Candidatus Thorarchaeota archaeon]
MEISKELTDAINEQINYELYSGYVYLSMATWFEEQNLDGMAHWMKVQAKEEFEHAERFWKHVTDRGSRVILKAIDAPQTEWASPADAFSDAYEHELGVTERIIKIGELAKDDKSALPMLLWFYDEQVEEEEQTMKIRDILRKIGDSVGPLYQYDTFLGKREG